MLESTLRSPHLANLPYEGFVSSLRASRLMRDVSSASVRLLLEGCLGMVLGVRMFIAPLRLV